MQAKRERRACGLAAPASDQRAHFYVGQLGETQPSSNEDGSNAEFRKRTQRCDPAVYDESGKDHGEEHGDPRRTTQNVPQTHEPPNAIWRPQNEWQPFMP
jgi:hypothetical protein